MKKILAVLAFAVLLIGINGCKDEGYNTPEGYAKAIVQKGVISTKTFPMTRGQKELLTTKNFSSAETAWKYYVKTPDGVCYVVVLTDDTEPFITSVFCSTFDYYFNK